MSKKDDFRIFVQSKPHLASYVEDGSMTWQKFYEMYDLYGENNDIWQKYNNTEEEKNDLKTSEFLNFIKNINIEKLQSGMESVSRVLSLVSEIGNKTETKEEYNPRPIYKHFED
jgi:hypothetical protein